MMSSCTVLEPHWYSLQQIQAQVIPAKLRPWLYDNGSLTQSLLNSIDGILRVHIRQQGWQPALPTEQRLLQLPTRRRTLVREVHLYNTQQPTLFARTVIPVHSLSGRARCLGHLGRQPLGAILFADPTTRRLTTEITRLHAQHHLYQRAILANQPPPSNLWGRRTLYQYAGQPLLVNEFFLPDIPEHPRCRNHLASLPTGTAVYKAIGI